ncbi:Transmembrane protein 234 [Beauveria bassiana]|uniref:Transmembrane protein 234 n=1 Tax=Beauveria bassiana TaxID=176275 RepID=A0A2N6NYJ6_BEABA|nr:Transmembrane protein 234 [Beauveria bassiana]
MESPSPQDKPPVFNYVLSFLLVGIAWGGTTPFIRKAAKSHKPPQHQILNDPAVQASWLRSKLYGALFSVVDLLRNPRYAVPLLLNLTGSVWFFLLIGQAVLGEWLVEGKVISRDTGAGMLFSLVGIGLCVYSKT